MTDLEVVNRALALIGNPPAISMKDTARAPARAIAVYEVCRDEVLRAAVWTCAKKRDRLWDCGMQATPWEASHYYGVGERCTNDTNKTYRVLVAGKSATSGGPTGISDEIDDGSVTWEYVEVSDAESNWCHWPSTPYEVGDFCSWDMGKVYVCIQAGTTAANNPPVGQGIDIVDGTVRWCYYAEIRPNRTRYAFQYMLPQDYCGSLKLPDSSQLDEKAQGWQYRAEGRFIYTNSTDAEVEYVYKADPSVWDALLQGTVSLRIAAEISFDITGKQALQASLFKFLGDQYITARAASQSEGNEGTEEPTRWEDA